MKDLLTRRRAKAKALARAETVGPRPAAARGKGVAKAGAKAHPTVHARTTATASVVAKLKAKRVVVATGKPPARPNLNSKSRIATRGRSSRARAARKTVRKAARRHR
jgi:hypothetical protein